MQRDRDDDRDEPQREKKSWREIDRMREGSGGSSDPSPRGRAAQERADEASKQYRKHLEERFSSEQGGPEGRKLAGAMREAHGTPGLADACRAYRDALGPPADPSLVSLFLDCGARVLVLAGLEALRECQKADAVTVRAGLRTQLRMLAEDVDGDVADAAEEILDDL